MPVCPLPDTGDPERGPGVGGPAGAAALRVCWREGPGCCPTGASSPRSPELGQGHCSGSVSGAWGLFGQGFPEEGRGGLWLRERPPDGDPVGTWQLGCTQPSPGVQVARGQHLAWRTGRRQRPGTGPGTGPGMADWTSGHGAGPRVWEPDLCQVPPWVSGLTFGVRGFSHCPGRQAPFLSLWVLC